MPAKDIVRVLRLIEYMGEREAVEKQVQRSIHGTVTHGKITITAASLHEFPQAVDERTAMLIRQLEEATTTIKSLTEERDRLVDAVERRRLIVTTGHNEEVGDNHE